MKIQVEGNIYLESDSFQFIIKEYTGAINVDKRTGKETEVYNTLGYFGKLDAALRHLIRMKLKASTASSLVGLRNDLNKTEMDILDFCEQLDLETKLFLRGGETPNEPRGSLGEDQSAQEGTGD